MENEPGLHDGAWRGPEPAASAWSAPDPEPEPASRRGRGRRLLLAAAGIAAAGALAYALVQRPAAVVEAAARAERALAPLETSEDPRSGERTSPFEGFAVSVETVPPGALVAIDGVERGEAPVLANLDCAPGERVEISARRRGLAPARVATTCRADTLVRLVVRLAR